MFTYDTDTEVDASCVAALNGEFWVIGGNIKRRQVKFWNKFSNENAFYYLS